MFHLQESQERSADIFIENTEEKGVTSYNLTFVYGVIAVYILEHL